MLSKLPIKKGLHTVDSDTPLNSLTEKKEEAVNAHTEDGDILLLIKQESGARLGENKRWYQIE